MHVTIIVVDCLIAFTLIGLCFTKSYQWGSVLYDTTLTTTVSICGVHPGQTLVFGGSQPRVATITLTNATTLTVTKGPDYDGQPIHFTVREFY